MAAHRMFRFYITDMFQGAVLGTDNEKKAEDYSKCEDYFVVDGDTGEWFNADGIRVQIEEMK